MYYTIKKKVSSEQRERLIILARFAGFEVDIYDDEYYLCLGYCNKELFSMGSPDLTNDYIDEYVTYERIVEFFKNEISGQVLHDKEETL